MSFFRFRIWPYILCFCILIVVGGGVFAYQFVSRLTPEQIIQSPFVRQAVTRQVGEGAKSFFDIAPEALGYQTPKTYLFLLENNTELRPAGGFIGAYAVLRLNRGHAEVLAIEGTESLDKKTPDAWRPVPPAPIADHLKVDRWYFRDSNWSPDFSESAKQALTFYRAEGGIAGESIDAIVAVTPTVLEELLRLTGDIRVQGMTFTADTVIEKLEYEVEYGYKDRNIAVADRKQIMDPFLHALLARFETSVITNYRAYIALAERMAREGHILFYSEDSARMAVARQAGVTGEMRQTDGDFLLWADANLAALKTDHAMKRTLSYSLAPEGNGMYVAKARMTYRHEGTFDWRTTRYLTYARVFVPKGSVIHGVTVYGADGKGMSVLAKERVDQGEALGKQWFGAFFSIEPGDTKSFEFSYTISDAIRREITEGSYTLFVQKQLGTLAHGLTLGLDFGKTIQAAMPPEAEKEWGDTVYRSASDLRVDREFTISLQH